MCAMVYGLPFSACTVLLHSPYNFLVSHETLFSAIPQVHHEGVMLYTGVMALRTSHNLMMFISRFCMPSPLHFPDPLQSLRYKLGIVLTGVIFTDVVQSGR